MITYDSEVKSRLNQLEEIYTSLRLNNITLSKTEASKIVGSRGILEKLVIARKIRTNNYTNGKFERWNCSAEDVLRHANFKQRGGKI